jgi:hypothetical protein
MIDYTKVKYWVVPIGRAEVTNSPEELQEKLNECGEKGYSVSAVTNKFVIMAKLDPDLNERARRGKQKALEMGLSPAEAIGKLLDEAD